jgi:hypothetical protein
MGIDKDLLKQLKQPARPCLCGKVQLVVDAEEETKLFYVFCPNCNKQGLRGKDINEAIKLWNKQKK